VDIASYENGEDWVHSAGSYSRIGMPPLPPPLLRRWEWVWLCPKGLKLVGAAEGAMPGGLGKEGRSLLPSTPLCGVAYLSYWL